MTKPINFGEYSVLGLAAPGILISNSPGIVGTAVGAITRLRAASCRAVESLNKHDEPDERNSHVPSCGARKYGGSLE